MVFELELSMGLTILAIEPIETALSIELFSSLLNKRTIELGQKAW